MTPIEALLSLAGGLIAVMVGLTVLTLWQVGEFLAFVVGYLFGVYHDLRYGRPADE